MSSTALPNFACSCEDDPALGDISWWRILAGAVIAVNAMTFAVAVNTSDDPQSDRIVLQVGTLAATAIISALLGGPLATAAFGALRRRRLTVEALFVLSYAGAIVASAISMISGSGPVFWDVAGITLVVYSVGRAVGRYSQQRALRALAEWDPHAGTCERVSADGRVESVAVAAVRKGDRLRVHPGMNVPADGEIVTGRAFLREAAMTGESFAVSRGEGETVLAGTVVMDSTIEMEAAVSGAERQVDRITAALQQVASRPAPSQILADRMMRWFVPVLVAVMLGTGAFWTWKAGATAGLFNAMSVLLVACPCALGFATPVSVWSAMRRLGSLGLIVKNGDAIEKLAAVDTVVFDKTGTLTVAGCYSADLVMAASSPLPEVQIRSIVAAVESRSEHPVAEALRNLGEADSFDCERVEIVPGTGVAARVRLRSKAWNVQIGMASRVWPAFADAADSAHRIAIVVDGTPAAFVRLEERFSPGLDGALDGLRQRGLECVLMTGDAETRASRIPIAAQHTGATPDAKVSMCRSLFERGRSVAFIGDGLNDAAAMSSCAVSIAIDGGAGLAQDVADLVWTRTDLRSLPSAISMCRRAVRVMRGTIWIAFGYNAVGIGLAAAGMLHPVAAAVLMTCSSLAVTFRALRLHDWELE